MNRKLVWLNLAGVAVLATLCGLQWRENRQLNLEAAQATRTRWGKQETLAEREQTLRGRDVDLERFREQLAETTERARRLEERLKALENEQRQWIQERDQWTTSATRWSEALSARDARLAELGAQLKTVVGERDGAIAKFNDLAGKYGRLVTELNAARSK